MRKGFTLKRASNKGFTLIELMMTVTIISLLSVAVFVALNPRRRLRDTKDARRATDVDTILTAIHQAIVDNGGSTPTKLPAASAGVYTQLGTGSSGCALTTTYCSIAATACADLMIAADAIDLTSYLASMPIDPTGGTTYTAAKTGYAVTQDTNGIITVKACGAENSAIQVSR